VQDIDHLQVGELINAVMNHDSSRVNDLLNSGVDPNSSIDNNKITALHFAAQINALTIVPLLVQAGASLEAITKPEGHTALDIACLHKHNKMIELLMTYHNMCDTRAN
jgi:ankyrin repeat protein